jgi:hypothetical protein
MLGTRADQWWLVLKMVAPCAVTLAAVVTLFVLLLSETEFRLFDHGEAPEDSIRMFGISAVATLSFLAMLIMVHLWNHSEPGVRFLRYSRRWLEVLSFVAVATLGASFAVIDMTFCVGEHNDAVFAALVLGMLAVGPLFIDRAIRLRSLLVVIAVYGVFASWILVQRHLDWNMHRHFLRAYSQIRVGMTREQVEGVMNNQFRGKRPLAQFGDSLLEYTLDPDDGRFDSEIILVRMIAGKVVVAEYLPD